MRPAAEPQGGRRGPGGRPRGAHAYFSRNETWKSLTFWRTVFSFSAGGRMVILPGERTVSAGAPAALDRGQCGAAARAFARSCGDEVCGPAAWGRLCLVHCPSSGPGRTSFSPRSYVFPPEPHTRTEATMRGRRAGREEPASPLSPRGTQLSRAATLSSPQRCSCGTGEYVSARRRPRPRPRHNSASGGMPELPWRLSPPHCAVAMVPSPEGSFLNEPRSRFT